MFLLRQEAASSDFAGCVEFMRNVFTRAGAELLVLRKWDERRLAYAIRGQRRGIFLLAYFKVGGVQIANIERDCTLSEQVLRALILRADHIGEVELELAGQDAELTLQLVNVGDDGDQDSNDRDEPAEDDAEGAEAAHADR